MNTENKVNTPQERTAIQSESEEGRVKRGTGTRVSRVVECGTRMTSNILVVNRTVDFSPCRGV